MHSKIEEVCASLDQVAQKIKESGTAYLSQWGWNFPSLTYGDFAEMASNISGRLKKANVEQVDDNLADSLSEIPNRIRDFQANSMQYFVNSNAQGVVPSYLALIEWIKVIVSPLFEWEVLQDAKAIPRNLANRLRALQVDLGTIIPEKEKLESEIRLIREARETADTLPIDLENLREARKKVDNFSSSAAELFGKIGTFHSDSEKLITYLSEKKVEADAIVAQCSEAYRVTTSTGLAGAFELRAKRLSNTMWIWVAVLIASLIAGAVIGSQRFNTFSDALKISDPKWGLIWMEFILSVLGLAAPIWLAWLATKQISQRFKLTEDYAFKASVAKAYEGYRREAAKFDNEFEARLFGSALTRLEEEPLRFVQENSHGSPWQELLDSKRAKQALDAFPETKAQIVELVKNAINSFKKERNKPASTATEDANP